jgi:predicted metal-dependent enzyme (double-stranded beta helix superfamily)
MAVTPTNGSLAALLDLPGRRLETRELVAVVARLARLEELWRPLVDHDPCRRQYESLFLDEAIGIWVISWMPGHDTGFHDHDGSRGAVAVVEGTIREERPVWGRDPRRIDARAGECFSFDETELHRMVVVADEPVVTIHAYSLPLKAMGVYRVEDDGYVRRDSVAWDEHLEAPGTAATTAGPS